MTLKIMLDTNSYDFIYENKLTEKFNQLIEKGEIENFGMYVQVDEIEKISDQKRKNQQALGPKLVPLQHYFEHATRFVKSGSISYQKINKNFETLYELTNEAIQ